MPTPPAALNLRAPAGEPGLGEHRSVWADALRSVADSWRFRARAGRISSHSLAAVLALAESFDRAAAALDSGSDGRASVDLDAMLLESEERFRLLVDSVTDYGIFVLDVDGRIATWNAGAERITGYRAEDVIGRPFTLFYTPEALESGHPQRELDIAARDGRYHEEGWRVRKDQSRYWVDATVTALRDDSGRLRGFAKVTRDLSERRRAEQALDAERANFQLLVESVRDYAIFMLDPTGRITTWNEGARRLKGYEAKEIIGQHFSRFYSQEDRDRRHPEAELELAARDGAYHEEGWRYRKDGSPFWADVTITALRKDGELKGFAKVTRDLTERVQQERALKEANVTLERRVEERTVELVALNKELEGFSYSVSHDLRAPLRAIDGFSKIVLDDYAEGGALDARGRGYLERIRAGSQRMAALIDDMLRLAKVTRAPFAPVPLDLATLAREVVATLDQRPGLTVVIPDALPAVGDPGLLRQVLANLLGNAFKFTSKKAAARIELGEVHVSGERRFFVRDDGAGFDMAYADKLFAPFQRLHDNDEFEGTGIGLATVHRVVSRHGGRIWAEGAPNGGATFWFTLEGGP